MNDKLFDMLKMSRDLIFHYFQKALWDPGLDRSGHFPVELDVLGLRPRTFNCQLEKVKRQIGYTFYIVKCTIGCTINSVENG